MYRGEEMSNRPLHGRVALVTGGGSGIGRAIALRFAQAGAAVVVLDLDEPRARETAETINDAGGQAMWARADVSRAADCAQAVARARTELGGMHILCNSAGIIHRATILQTSEEEWDRVMAVNLKAIFLLGREVIPLMAAAGGGAIINIASGWGLVGGPKAAAYCASKGAVVQLTKALAIDHGGQGIRVNCICPGDTDTPMLRHEASQLGEPSDLFLAEAAARPLGRVGRPEDIAEGALYLASDASAFVTGTALVIDGGLTSGIWGG